MNGLGDGFASTLFLDAMNRHRGACMQPDEMGSRNLPERKDPATHDHVHRWEPWVRSYLCAQTLISHLDFRVEPEQALVGKTPLSVTLHTLTPAGSRQDLVTLVRPPDALFKEQARKVLDWADLREERIPEILTQIGNTYAFWGALIPLHTERLRYTREVLDAAVQLAMFVEMRFKHELACWRPADYSPQVQPLVTTPGHGSLPSGHCVEAYVIKEVLEGLLGLNDLPASDEKKRLQEQFDRTAERISTNRVIAGLHFPVDNVAGRLLGTTLGRYFVFCCRGTSAKGSDFIGRPRLFKGDKCPAGIEFDPRDADQDLKVDGQVYGFDKGEQFPDTLPAASVLTVLWQSALEELKRLQLAF
ncbi:phosphatase PAP2 family protein [Ideonella sp. YS5]|uniref:phosphatase PAP2 family protein n=1 Tax=Ideonella sp. YS5 TaxID=3453714 RepID=UPI003EE86606